MSKNINVVGASLWLIPKNPNFHVFQLNTISKYKCREYINPIYNYSIIMQIFKSVCNSKSERLATTAQKTES